MTNPLENESSKDDAVTEKQFELLIKKEVSDILKLNPNISDLKMIQTVLSEMKHSIATFQPFRDYRKVCIFGSARTKPGTANYRLTETLSKRLTESGYMLITGAGPGIMEAGNKGALPDRSFGLNILLPFEQEPNAYIKNSSKLVSFKYFFTRKLFFIKESDATIFFPGGFGTHDEGFELFTLLQTGRCSPRPLILFSEKDDTYWSHWIQFIESELADKNLISKPDLDLFRQFYDIDKALDYIRSFFEYYHSIRYLEKYSIIRLNKSISKQSLDQINTEFSHILLSGRFEQVDVGQVPEENGDYPEKPRLLFHFNKKDYSTLCQLIHHFH